jgi:hypothetical protein
MLHTGHALCVRVHFIMKLLSLLDGVWQREERESLQIRRLNTRKTPFIFVRNTSALAIRRLIILTSSSNGLIADIIGGPLDYSDIVRQIMNPAMSGSPASQPTRYPRDTNTSPPEYQFIVYTLLLILAVLAMPTLMFCRRCPNFTKIFIFKNFLQEVEIIVEAEATIDTEANFANAEALAGEESIDGTTDIVGEVVARKSRRSVLADGVQAYCVTVMDTTSGPSVPLDRYEL